MLVCRLRRICRVIIRITSTVCRDPVLNYFSKSVASSATLRWVQDGVAPIEKLKPVCSRI